jgi:long-chain acyl-CoA synthetase
MFDPSKPPLTLAELAHRSFARHAARPCLGVKAKDGASYGYTTYAEIAARVRQTAGGLMSLGLERGDRAAILAESRPEWPVADLSCQMLGVISVPLFATLPPGQVQYILQDSGATVVFVSTTAQLNKILAAQDQLPDLRHVVVMDEVPDETTSIEAQSHMSPLHQLSFAELERHGAEYLRAHPGAYEATWPAAAAEDVATIIYTSGTTGEPKGVMLTHRNFISNLEAILEAIRDVLELSHEDVFLSFLPLAHVYERTAGYYLPLRLGAAIAYTESLFTVDKNLREARPTIMFCVPRLYESMREKLFAAAKSLPEDRRGKYLDALALAQKAGAARGKLPGAPQLSLGEQLKYKLYNVAVYSKIRDKFGGRLRAFVSGGAPMAPELGALFTGLGLTILQGYGLTETSPVMAVNRPGRVRLDTVGELLSSLEVKIATDGEILGRGASIMKGYWNKPEATADAIDADGWFHTGDIGVLDNGYLKITDRKKDLLVLANGKKVAPAPIEMKLAQSRYIAQAVLLGDKLKAVTALIVPRTDALREYAARENLSITDEAELLRSSAINKLLRQEIDALTNDLADFERIRKFVLLPHPFSVESGELTPTLKIKRRVVAEKYAAMVGGEA